MDTRSHETIIEKHRDEFMTKRKIFSSRFWSSVSPNESHPSDIFSFLTSVYFLPLLPNKTHPFSCIWRCRFIAFKVPYNPLTPLPCHYLYHNISVTIIIRLSQPLGIGMIISVFNIPYSPRLGVRLRIDQIWMRVICKTAT